MHTWPFYSKKSAAAGLLSDPRTVLVIAWIYGVMFKFPIFFTTEFYKRIIGK